MYTSDGKASLFLVANKGNPAAWGLYCWDGKAGSYYCVQSTTDSLWQPIVDPLDYADYYHVKLASPLLHRLLTS